MPKRAKRKDKLLAGGGGRVHARLEEEIADGSGKSYGETCATTRSAPQPVAPPSSDWASAEWQRLDEEIDVVNTPRVREQAELDADAETHLEPPPFVPRSPSPLTSKELELLRKETAEPTVDTELVKQVERELVDSTDATPCRFGRIDSETVIRSPARTRPADLANSDDVDAILEQQAVYAPFVPADLLVGSLDKASAPEVVCVGGGVKVDRATDTDERVADCRSSVFLPGTGVSQGRGSTQASKISRNSSFSITLAFEEHLQKLQQHFDAGMKQTEQRRGARWISAQDESDTLVGRRGDHSWRLSLLNVLQSKGLQGLLTILLIVDVLVVFTELFLDTEFPHCRYIVRDAVPCCHIYDSWGADTTGTRRLATFFAEAGAYQDKIDYLCGYYSTPEHPISCDDHKFDTAHTLHAALVMVSISVLSLFEIELALLIVTLDWQFFRNPLYVLDCFVVTSSLVLELWLHSLGNEKHTDELSGILVLGRLWRFIRIGHAIYSSASMSTEHEMKEMKEELLQLELEYHLALNKAASKS
uniref:Voltage-gated hydrogen channel 1 n=1 Tax=Coccolithus braarudii TaxID=221442 RepID=A0A7S0LMF1_9EUKA|mmetsp:Transcript_45328/g.96427  ORF Transcript_45328/g.96427 Transcript_45328/m.96427 type:complete len:533 (+) Transcript_45328:169-1767(+)